MLMSWDDGCIMFDTVEDFAKTWEHVRRLGTSHMPVILGLYDGFTAAFIPVYRMFCMPYAHIPDVHDNLYLVYSCIIPVIVTLWNHRLLTCSATITN